MWFPTINTKTVLSNRGTDVKAVVLKTKHMRRKEDYS